MDYKYIITAPISLEDLDTLAAGLEAACGGNKVIISEMFEVVVHDVRQYQALKVLFRDTKPGLTPKRRRAFFYQVEGEERNISPKVLKWLLNTGELEGVGLLRKGKRYVVTSGALVEDIHYEEEA